MNEKFPLALPEGSVLAGQYIIVKVLGQGGFGITYEAQDHKSGVRVAIKEFFPDAMATRTQGTVVPFSGERGESYQYGKECFLQEAETLAKFIGNENIVRIHSYFEENGTAYFVMDFIEGTSFDDYIKQHGRLSFEETSRILIPVMDALGAVHEKGIVHRDVTPDNIYITEDGTVKLLDFGAARYSLGDKSRSLDVVLKHGFAPKEQYTRRGRQGPYTDIYSLGATFYFALTGKRPPDSVERMDEDELVPPSTLGVKLSADAETAILKALNVQPQDRFQNMRAFKNAMLYVTGSKKDTGMTVAPAMSVPDTGAAAPVNQRFFTPPQETPGVTPGAVSAAQSPAGSGTTPDGKNPKKKLIPIIAIAAAALALIVTLVVILSGGNSDNGSGAGVAAATEKTSEPEPASQAQEEPREENTPSGGTSSAPESTQEAPEEEEPAEEEPPAAQTPGETEQAGTVRNLAPVILGNNVNNLITASNWTWDGAWRSMRENEGEKFFLLHCLSEVDGLVYAVAPQTNRAYVSRDNRWYDVPELERFAGETNKLLVTKEYFFVYSSEKEMLYCVDRQSGDIVGERALESLSFTFIEYEDYGYLVSIGGEKGAQKIYLQPAGDLWEDFVERESIIDLPADGVFDSILYDGDMLLYVIGIKDDTGGRMIFRYDLSDGSTDSVTYKNEGSTILVGNVYGDYVYLYCFDYDEATKLRSNQMLARFHWQSKETIEVLYELEDSMESLWGLSLSRDGSQLFYTQLPYTYAAQSDGSGITDTFPYSYTK